MKTILETVFVSCPDRYFPTGPRPREESPVKQRGKLVVKLEFRKLTIPIWVWPRQFGHSETIFQYRLTAIDISLLKR